MSAVYTSTAGQHPANTLTAGDWFAGLTGWATPHYTLPVPALRASSKARIATSVDAEANRHA